MLKVAQNDERGGDLIGDQMAGTLLPVNLLRQFHFLSLKATYAR